jgi:hypothetical protein
VRSYPHQTARNQLFQLLILDHHIPVALDLIALDHVAALDHAVLRVTVLLLHPSRIPSFFSSPT